MGVCLGQPFLWLFKGEGGEEQEQEQGVLKEKERRKGGLSISHDGEYLVAMAMI